MTLLITSLAVYRISRLLTVDTIFDTPRAWVGSKALWLDTVTSCVWCCSIWVGAAATIVLYASGGLVLPGVAWMGLPFAFSAIAGLLSSWE